MMAPAVDELRAAVAKAELAYGAVVLADLAKSVDHLKARHGRLERCMQALQIRIPPALLWQKILALRRRVGRLTT